MADAFLAMQVLYSVVLACFMFFFPSKLKLFFLIDLVFSTVLIFYFIFFDLRLSLIVSHICEALFRISVSFVI